MGFNVGRIDEGNALGSPTITDARHDDISERGRDAGGRAVPNPKGHADWPMIAHLDLRREGKLLLPQKLLKLGQERYHMLFHGYLAVLDIRRSLSGVVSRDPPLSVLFDGGERNLCRKLIREFLGVYVFSLLP
jgi:hypothetical protein